MRNVFRCFAILLPLVIASVSRAQDSTEVEEIRSAVYESLRRSMELSAQLEEDLYRILPSVAGWSCHRAVADPSTMPGAIAAIPTLHLECGNNDEQSLRVVLSLDRSSADIYCQLIEQTILGIADGRVKPDLFRFFSTDNWQVMRSAIDLKGCSLGVLSFVAQGERSQAAIDAGPSSIDHFGEAMLALDVSGILMSDTFAQQQRAIDDFVSGLMVQSSILARMIPLPAGSSTDIITSVPSNKIDTMELPQMMALAFGPSASATLEFNGCRLLVELSASELAIDEAKRTGGRWARSGGTDGEVQSVYIRRNTDRFVGRERVDGTGIETLVDSQVIVRVVITGAHPCESNPNIVERLFRDIMSNDLSVFGNQ